MSEFRQDVITKEWVLIAPDKSQKIKIGNSTQPIDSKDKAEASCVFCPGNEELNPDTILAFPNLKNWRLRIIPKKYEQVTDSPKQSHHLFVTRPGLSEHELVILRPHGQAFSSFEIEDLEELFKAWHTRLYALQGQPGIKYVQISHNHLPQSNHSVPHSHSQIFALPIIPDSIHQLIESATKYRHLHESCPYCDLVEFESQNQRIVARNEDFIAFCPYASKYAYQVNIMPVKHEADFTKLKPAQRQNLVQVLSLVTKGLARELNHPDFNIILRNLPSNPHETQVNSFHWHLEILPRLNQSQGLEIGTRIPVNPYAPEKVAQLLSSL